ncbi:MAG: outer membrane lipoprotein-sorting protein [Verrucomicrobiota bacterium]|nr:outer membrane lipoprotein-sorting protein [Verrucomicrobiota bacterium]
MKNSLIHRAAAAALRRAGHDTKPAAAKQVLNAGSRAARAVVLLLACALVPVAFGAPSAPEILANARQQVARQQAELSGQLRENDRIIPFRLTQTGPVIRYTFSDPPEALQVRLGDSGAQLEEITDAGVDKVAGREFTQNVRGTAITYEDLALRFIYWTNARVVGDDYINTRRVWKLELQPNGRDSMYSRVFLWCEQQSGALMRMEGFDWNGKLVKRFEVVSVQEIEGRLFLKQMRIEQIRPDTGKVQARTYLDIKK